jgi:CheY-like chemotaxis protein
MSNSPKILLVDDAEDGRILISHLLKGFEITSAENGKIAVEKFMASRFDLILMDMQMPICDGFQATREIRALEKARGLAPCKIIALTAFEKPEELALCLEAGCDLCLTKPVKREALLGLIAPA